MSGASVALLTSMSCAVTEKPPLAPGLSRPRLAWMETRFDRNTTRKFLSPEIRRINLPRERRGFRRLDAVWKQVAHKHLIRRSSVRARRMCQ